MKEEYKDMYDALTYAIIQGLFNGAENKKLCCKECGSNMIETQTLHTEEQEITFYECENCEYEMTQN